MCVHIVYVNLYMNSYMWMHFQQASDMELHIIEVVKNVWKLEQLTTKQDPVKQHVLSNLTS